MSEKHVALIGLAGLSSPLIEAGFQLGTEYEMGLLTKTSRIAFARTKHMVSGRPEPARMEESRRRNLA